jgi:hypothetical protein
MNRRTRTLAALTGAAALTVTGMSPASAALWHHEDAVGDVQSYTIYENRPDSGPNPAPANTNADITRFTANHTARRVKLITTLRDITAASGEMYYEIRTGTRRYLVIQRLGTRDAVPFDDAPAFGLYRLDGSGDRVRCAGVRRSVDRTTEQARVSIPRSCLGRPRWVRVGAGATSYKQTKTSFTMLQDDAIRDGLVKYNLALSPRIMRG